MRGLRRMQSGSERSFMSHALGITLSLSGNGRAVELKDGDFRLHDSIKSSFHPQTTFCLTKVPHHKTFRALLPPTRAENLSLSRTNEEPNRTTMTRPPHTFQTRTKNFKRDPKDKPNPSHPVDFPFYLLQFHLAVCYVSDPISLCP
jgi:hypothetical protein